MCSRMSYSGTHRWVRRAKFFQTCLRNRLRLVAISIGGKFGRRNSTSAPRSSRPQGWDTAPQEAVRPADNTSRGLARPLPRSRPSCAIVGNRPETERIRQVRQISRIRRSGPLPRSGRSSGLTTSSHPARIRTKPPAGNRTESANRSIQVQRHAASHGLLAPPRLVRCRPPRLGTGRGPAARSPPRQPAGCARPSSSCSSPPRCSPRSRSTTGAMPSSSS